MGFPGQRRFHLQKGLNHDRLVVLADPVGDQRGHIDTLIIDISQNRVRREGQMQPPDAPVARVRPPFHHAPAFQPIDQARHGDRLHLQQFSEFFLRDAGLTLKPYQNGPLCPGHAVRAGTFVRVDPKQTRDIVQQEQQVSPKIWQYIPRDNTERL